MKIYLLEFRSNNGAKFEDIAYNFRVSESKKALLFDTKEKYLTVEGSASCYGKGHSGTIVST